MLAKYPWISRAVPWLPASSDKKDRESQVGLLLFFLRRKKIPSTEAKQNHLVWSVCFFSTAFPLHSDCCRYCLLAQHMAHGTWLMMAHYVILIKNRSLSEISLCLPPSVSGHSQHQSAESTESNGYSLQLLGSPSVFDCFCPRKWPLKIKLLCHESCHPFGRVYCCPDSRPSVVQESPDLFIMAVV